MENDLDEARKISRDNEKKLDRHRKNLSHEKKMNKTNKEEMINVERELGQTMNENQLLRSELETESQVRQILEEELTKEVIMGKVFD